jgi:hypothetical protein
MDINISGRKITGRKKKEQRKRTLLLMATGFCLQDPWAANAALSDQNSNWANEPYFLLYIYKNTLNISMT